MINHWLYWGKTVLTCVRAPKGTSRHNIINKALDSHDRVPLVPPEFAPFEWRMRLMFAEVRT